MTPNSNSVPQKAILFWGTVILIASAPLTRGADASPGPDTPKTAPSTEAAPSSPDKLDKAEKGGKRQARLKEGTFESLVQTIRALPPEKRHQLRENLRTWQDLSDGQRQQLRERDTVLRKKAAEELSACLPSTKLSEEEMELLQKRYIEERRKIENKLRSEMESRRKTEIDQLTDRLREELRSKNPASEAN